MDANDEANITEIEILPDGRICVFGTSMPVIDVVSSLAVLDDRLRERLTTIRQHQMQAVDSGQNLTSQTNGNENQQ